MVPGPAAIDLGSAGRTATASAGSMVSVSAIRSGLSDPAASAEGSLAIEGAHSRVSIIAQASLVSVRAIIPTEVDGALLTVGMCADIPVTAPVSTGPAESTGIAIFTGILGRKGRRTCGVRAVTTAGIRGSAGIVSSESTKLHGTARAGHQAGIDSVVTTVAVVAIQSAITFGPGLSPLGIDHIIGDGEVLGAVLNPEPDRARARTARRIPPDGEAIEGGLVVDL